MTYIFQGTVKIDQVFREGSEYVANTTGLSRAEVDVLVLQNMIHEALRDAGLDADFIDVRTEE